LTQINFLPQDLLRNALEGISSSSEAFMQLKSKFIIQLGALSVAGYICGIGDRHLENYLFNYSNGDIVAIDFGVSFGLGISMPIPDLVPFRLTHVFRELMSPVGVDGPFRHSMIAAMVALRRKRHLIFDFCEIFIEDPLLDWEKCIQVKFKSASSDTNVLSSTQNLFLELQGEGDVAMSRDLPKGGNNGKKKRD